MGGEALRQASAAVASRLERPGAAGVRSANLGAIQAW